jgi:hypothetical protein
MAYEFATALHSGALETAYLERGAFRRARTDEQKDLHQRWAAVRAGETDEFTGTISDIQETAGLLREWGEENAENAEAGLVGNFEEKRYHRLRLAFARVAVTMAGEMEAQADAAQGVDPNLDIAAVYAFLLRQTGNVA